MTDIPFNLDLSAVALRLLLTVVFTGIIGWDRERFRKPAGLRTHVLVGLGSCLVMILSVVTGPESDNAHKVDPRIVANVLTGIGFLGAGTILHYKDGLVSGLTTAASLWVVACIGMAVGCGFYSAALLTTALVMGVLYFMGWLDDYVEGSLYHRISIHAKISAHFTETAKQMLRDEGIKIIRTEAQMLGPSEKYVIIHFKPIPSASGRLLARKVEKIPGVKEVVFN